MMMDNPLFGCGLGQFSRTYGTEYNTINTRWTAAHSLYIEFIGQFGVPGLLYILTVIFLTLRTFRRARSVTNRIHNEEARMVKQIMLGAECGFASYLVATFFLSSMAYPHLWHFTAMAGMGLAASRTLAARESRGKPTLREIPVAPELP
jgi:O-antigen ligase